jgi:hypothetical protein
MIDVISIGGDSTPWALIEASGFESIVIQKITEDECTNEEFLACINFLTAMT